MKKIILFSVVALWLLVVGGCEKEKNTYQLQGTWVEKEPHLFDRVSDTIVFSSNYTIEKHFWYTGYSYSQSDDSLIFTKNKKRRAFSFGYINSNEIVINNFNDRSITGLVKDIHFLKIK